MTRFRGCIDIHAGQVKQIVGGTLKQDDTTHDSTTTENFVSTQPLSYYANLYKQNHVEGCHVIKLGSNPANDAAAKEACAAWPGHLQVGGGINIDNALQWLEEYKASHVILTLALFTNNEFDWDKLKQVSAKVGKNRLIVDLSCRTVESGWAVAINKWQTITSTMITPEFLADVAQYCDEFLIHAADVEGLCRGIDETLVTKLGEWCPEGFAGKIVYAGGANSVDNLATVDRLSQGKVDLTYGSALDIFGGKLVKFADVVAWNQSQ